MMGVGQELILDLTLVTDSLAGICSWTVIRDTTIGSDHYPINTVLGVGLEGGDNEGVEMWAFGRADWGKFGCICDKGMEAIDTNTDVDTLNISVCEGILDAARKAIQKKGGKRVKKIFPWWTEECDKAVKSRNKAFKMLKRNQFSESD